MKLIDEFVEKVLNTDESFVIAKGGISKRYLYFIQDKIGNAKYIYGKYSYDDELFHTDVDLELRVVAIVAEQKVYVIGGFELNVFGLNSGDLPANVHHIKEIYDIGNEKVASVIFPKFYDSLPIEEITDERTLEGCRQTARRILIEDNVDRKVKIKPVFDVNDASKFLCGYLDFEEEAIVRLEEQKELWVKEKSFNSAVDKYIKDRSVVEDYEMKIVKGIRSVDAKTVMVEFEFNGKKASEKISVERLLYVLNIKAIFQGCYFSSMEKGDELIKKLGASTWKHCPLSTDNYKERCLTCKNIVSITYGKKVLYEKHKR